MDFDGFGAARPTVYKSVAGAISQRTVSSTAPGRMAEVGRHSMDRLRELVLSGGFSHAASVDRDTGEIVDSEARAIFAALPAVTPATTADELVGHGLLTQAPRQLHVAREEPRYRVGRELFVRTRVSYRETSRGVGIYDSEGEPGFTHRAVLRAQRGEDFLVDVEGAPEHLSFPRAEVFAWNEACTVGASGGTVSGVQIDYNSPLLKAHICAGYLDIADELATLDFGAARDEVCAKQEKLIHRLASRVRMKYVGQGEGYGGPRVGSLLHGGQGVCFVQRAVAGAYLQAFAPVLAFDVQMAIGRTLRLDVPHGFVVLTLRPSLRRYVCDPAWSEPLTDLKVAFYDAAWGHDRRLVGLEGQQELTVRPSEVELPEEDA
jgi:hypothetical protein